MVGEVVDTEIITYVAKFNSDHIACANYATSMAGRSTRTSTRKSSSPANAALVSADPADRRDTRQRLYEESVREEVFERDDYACQVCGRNREKALAAGETHAST